MHVVSAIAVPGEGSAWGRTEVRSLIIVDSEDVVRPKEASGRPW